MTLLQLAVKIEIDEVEAALREAASVDAPPAEATRMDVQPFEEETVETPTNTNEFSNLCVAKKSVENAAHPQEAPSPSNHMTPSSKGSAVSIELCFHLFGE